MEFVIVEVPEYTALTRQATCSHADLGPTISQLFGEIISGNPDAELVDAACLYYLDWRADDCQIEGALPVDMGTDAGAGSTLKTYPACQALQGTYTGPYEGLADAWMQAWTYVQDNGLNASGTPWDRYVTDPGEEPDSSKWITEIYIPVIVPKIG